MAEDPARRTRIGVFGSAFNPPHLGHHVLLGEAIWQLGLDNVLIVPTGHAYHKQADSEPGSGQRLVMARAAFADLPGCEVIDIEVGREGPSYTVETISEISAAQPGSELVLLLGADAAIGFPGWRDPEEILELAGLAIAPRPGTGRDEVLGAIEPVCPPDRVRFFDMPETEITSSLVRRRIEEDIPWEHLVPAGVGEAIRSGGIYRG